MKKILIFFSLVYLQLGYPQKNPSPLSDLLIDVAQSFPEATLLSKNINFNNFYEPHLEYLLYENRHDEITSKKKLVQIVQFYLQDPSLLAMDKDKLFDHIFIATLLHPKHRKALLQLRSEELFFILTNISSNVFEKTTRLLNTYLTSQQKKKISKNEIYFIQKTKKIYYQWKKKQKKFIPLFFFNAIQVASLFFSDIELKPLFLTSSFFTTYYMYYNNEQIKPLTKKLKNQVRLSHIRKLFIPLPVSVEKKFQCDTMITTFSPKLLPRIF